MYPMHSNTIYKFPQQGYEDEYVSIYSTSSWVVPIEEAVKNELLENRNTDGSHDIGHLQRVSTLSRLFAREEGANELVAYAAGMLHDIVNLPKNHPNIENCSWLASERAKIILLQLRFPAHLMPSVCHAIHAHSFSANIEPKTIEAKCLQDADRMEALGAFGLMRVFYVSGKFGSKIMDEADPEGLHRKHNDKEYALDHFPIKLLTLFDTMKTYAGKQTALSLSKFVEDFRNDIIQDCKKGDKQSGRFMIAEAYHHAGQKNMPLFDLNDPFANAGRSLDPDKYALDKLLLSNDPYVLKFINQLKYELNGYRLNNVKSRL